jgi:hypothetical protein
MRRKGYKEIEKEDKEEDDEYALIEPDYRTRKFVHARLKPVRKTGGRGCCAGVPYRGGH